MWRQGDVFVSAIESFPAEVGNRPLAHGVLVHGELTGHTHRLDDPRTAQLFAGRALGELFLDVPAGGTRIVHEEHGAIDLPPGLYRVWRQREYTPKEIRIVCD
jgi:hypothetical protein